MAKSWQKNLNTTYQVYLLLVKLQITCDFKHRLNQTTSNTWNICKKYVCSYYSKIAISAPW